MPQTLNPIQSNTPNNPYYDVPFLPLENSEQTTKHGAQFFSNVKQLQVGYGSSVFRVDRDGMWAGAEDFASAPWSVDWDGNMIANSITLSGYIPTGGALSDIGSGNITSTYIGSNAITTAKIATNAITATKIAANAVTASKIDVDELSAITADVGTLTAGEIEGVVISSENSGTRTVISGSLTLWYDSSSQVASAFASSGIFYLDANESSGNDIVFEVGSAGIILMRSGGTSFVSFDEDYGIIPFVDDTYDLGASGTGWRDGWFTRDVEIEDDLFVGNDVFIVDGNFEIAGDGFFNLSQMSGSTASGTSGDQDGSMYYRTDDDVVRVKLNGTWETVAIV